MSAHHPPLGRTLLATTAAVAAALALLGLAQPASAASSKGCAGGGFTLSTAAGQVLARPGFKGTVPADQLGDVVRVQGHHVTFTVSTASLGVTDWTLTGAPNPLRLVTEPLTVFASKTPDHRGLSLTSGLTAELKDTDLVISRDGPGLAMKLQAKDCPQGGIFQMEPERADGTRTVVTHTLADDVVYFDNPNFRERIGTTVPFVTEAGETIQIPVQARINFGSNLATAQSFVGRDSPQVATRLPQCNNSFGTACGGVSRWSVASGGRMGQVMGEDAVEVTAGASDCVEDCQAQNRIRGRAVVLGFPWPIPESSLLTPRTP